MFTIQRNASTVPPAAFTFRLANHPPTMGFSSCIIRGTEIRIVNQSRTLFAKGSDSYVNEKQIISCSIFRRPTLSIRTGAVQFPTLLEALYSSWVL